VCEQEGGAEVRQGAILVAPLFSSKNEIIFHFSFATWTHQTGALSMTNEK